jgi:hypothetical protein
MDNTDLLDAVITQYKRQLSDKAGDLILADLSDFCGAMQTNFKMTQGMIDPYQLARLEGRREVYLHIMARLNIDLSTVRQIIKENKERYVRSNERITS